MSSNIEIRSVVYQIDGQTYESRLAYDPKASAAQPGLLMAPNWMGVSQGAEDIAKAVAAKGYVVLLADLYGQQIRPSNNDEAGAAMMPLKDDRALLRKRMQAGLDQLLSQAGVSLDSSKIATFGFCFGGCCSLELARTGAELKAAISFHGTLDTPNPADAKNIKGSVLVLHGASDPLVPKEQLPAFEEEMNAAGVDWQLHSYGGAFHSFTDPHANVPGMMMYDAKVSSRAFKSMHDLLSEVFG
ncbi:dienelactone hydrolase family protein [Pseudomonas savastanoi pv. phaseolicola]|uniref:Dienelactone hydrolase protein n=3 Tax=Pseudomonas savastanoi TaxID=29438 RepID=A0A3M4MEW5_PSESG|nr:MULTISPECIES: dienelactone hydrolase family protein [Pseudomonas]KPB80898.1 Dienelactone hydrolase family protein [Pseudomonas syringae pv. maculicola]AAZ34411.1 dienelactone hydrolase family protein [Pseudomonas savastanoi pv. phaseolicola 1448A]KPB40279.1 Dienelactone hydrolase family protein [Pseudomonas savastanoi pv. phaseolicola]KPB41186.1 Dienelactone hydrolase family protein [Pseudomonas savastanoi pv. phaseolicola]KPB46345.1 Dienelactone hydrolase family protein [Pseudomonas savast